MEFLTKLENLYTELKTISDAIQFVEKKLSRAKTADERDELNREEFRLAMDMSKVYGNMEKLMMQAVGSNDIIEAKKIKKQADQLMQTGIIDVIRDV